MSLLEDIWGFRDAFKEAGLLDDLAKMLDYTNEALVIVKGYGGGLHPVLVRTFILENLSRIGDFARAYAQHVGESTMRALCEEFESMLEGGDVDG